MRTPSKNTKNNSQGIFFVTISCQRVSSFASPLLQHTEDEHMDSLNHVSLQVGKFLRFGFIDLRSWESQNVSNGGFSDTGISEIPPVLLGIP